VESNVGERDRLFRTIFGVFGMLLGFLFIQGVIGIILGILGLVSLVTGIVGFCGIYKLLGISTRHEESAPPSDPTVKKPAPKKREG
jgi:hypothetical protein